MYYKLNKMSAAEFDQVLAKQSDFLRPYAINLTKDPDSASDLLQETLYRALANREKYSVGTNIKAWLYTILRNTFINNYRKKIKQRELFVQWPGEGYLDRSYSSFTADGPQQAREIWRMVQELPNIFSNPFMLYFEGYKYSEIADMLKEPLGTIKSRIHFARKLLKAQLEHQ